jgi:hypothetical protein
VKSLVPIVASCQEFPLVSRYQPTALVPIRPFDFNRYWRGALDAQDEMKRQLFGEASMRTLAES